MFDLGWAEFLIICGIALFVIGPKDLPAIAYQVGKFIRRIRYLQYAITGQFDDFMAKAEAKHHESNMPEGEKMELDHDPYDEADADASMHEMMPLPKTENAQTEEKVEKADEVKNG